MSPRIQHLQSFHFCNVAMVGEIYLFYLFFGTNPSLINFLASHTSFFFIGASKSSSFALAYCLNSALLNTFCCQASSTSSWTWGCVGASLSGEELDGEELVVKDSIEGRLEVTGPILTLNLKFDMLSRHLIVISYDYNFDSLVLTDTFPLLGFPQGAPTLRINFRLSCF